MGMCKLVKVISIFLVLLCCHAQCHELMFHIYSHPSPTSDNNMKVSEVDIGDDLAKQPPKEEVGTQ